MGEKKFRSREERRTFMARRHLRAGKQVPLVRKTKKPVASNSENTHYRHGFLTRLKRSLGNLFLRYPTFVAAGLLATAAYIWFREANALTQWAGSVALTALIAANPERAAGIVKKSHEYMTYGVTKAGEKMGDPTSKPEV